MSDSVTVEDVTAVEMSYRRWAHQHGTWQVRADQRGTTSSIDVQIGSGPPRVLTLDEAETLAAALRAAVAWSKERGDSPTPAAAALTPFRIADDAIGLFLEYRDVHGRDEDAARREATLEVAQGCSAVLPGEENAARVADLQPTTAGRAGRRG